ncbi:hypothetical protein QAD02_017775 [Eretmocerus hayati]|uniref:Uncharacterized protein n=1 Tax=Eretmocerus hayati TaxID=131215 RepID=A0ACC2PET9_9HYME|nr:hypothetical protein QAD02_017775 [Eretmocerus hayati]
MADLRSTDVQRLPLGNVTNINHNFLPTHGFHCGNVSVQQLVPVLDLSKNASDCDDSPADGTANLDGSVLSAFTSFNGSMNGTVSSDGSVSFDGSGSSDFMDIGSGDVLLLSSENAIAEPLASISTQSSDVVQHQPISQPRTSANTIPEQLSSQPATSAPTTTPRTLAQIREGKLLNSRSRFSFCSILPSTFIMYAKATVEYLPGEVEERWFAVSHVDEDGNPVSAKGPFYDSYKAFRRRARKIKRPGASRLRRYWDEVNGIEDDESNGEKNVGTFMTLHINNRLARKLTFLADYGEIEAFSATKNALIQNWPEISKLIISLAERYRSSPWIDAILNENGTITTSVHRQNVALMLVPALIHKLMKGKKTVGDWRPTPTEMTNSYILQVKTLAELKTQQDAFHKLMSEKKVPVQAYVLMCGSLDKVEAQYAVVNKVMYSVSTPVEAVDICFKSCVCMRTSFSKISDHTWKFFSSYVYKINTPGKIAAVGSLEMYLDQLRPAVSSNPPSEKYNRGIMDFLQQHSFSGAINKSILHKEKLKFCLALHHLIPVRSYVESIIEQFDQFITNLLIPHMTDELKKKLDSSTYYKVKHIIEENRHPFEAFSTEKKQLKIFRTESVLVDPEKFRIGDKVVEKFLSATEPDVTFEPVLAVNIPLIRSMEVFFQLPGVYDALVAYQAKLQKSKTMSNYSQGKMWNSKYLKFREKGECYFLELFGDEFDPGNALGSAAGEQKLFGAYVSCSALPPHIAFKMYSIFVATLFYAKHGKGYGNEAVFSKIIEELSILYHNGLRININGKAKTLYFALTQVIGDNLSMNAMCGYPESFIATIFCRICLAVAFECRCLTREVPNLVRTKEKYDNAVAQNEMDEVPPLDGITEVCVFNKVPEYHIGENHSVDVMHDFGEGVCDYTVGNVLHGLIFDDGIIDVKTLNQRIKEFDFGPHETNRPRKVRVIPCKDSKRRGKKCKIRLKSSSAESLCLTRYLGLIIGDLIPEDNKYWQIYLKLRQMIDIVTAPKVTPWDAEKLADLVSDHNFMYTKLFGPLKPKMHFLTHYPRLLLLNGPLINCWGMPFERKNKELKEVAGAVKNNRNLPYTIAMNNQINMCYLKEFSDGVTKDYLRGPLEDELVSDSSIQAYFPESAQKNCIRKMKHLQLLGKKYCEGTIFLAEIHGVDEPYFGKIVGIYDVSGEIYVVASILGADYFHKTLHAYIVPKTVLTTKALHIDRLPRIDPMLCVDAGDHLRITSRYAF